MSQGSTVLPTVGTISGLAEQGLINAALLALLTNNSGGSAPSGPQQFQFWADTSVGGQITLRQYINTTWVPIWVIDTGNGDLSFAQSSPQAWAVASGTHDAITAAYDPPVTTLVDGMVLFFRATSANLFSGGTTFSPNGLTAHPITKNGGQNLWVGDIPGGLAEVAVRYNLANTRWELLNPPDVPVGGIVPYFGGQIPPGFALPQGQNLSATTYPAANVVLNTIYGNPGGGNFTMPDLRGRFFFNLDSGGSGRITAGGGNFDGTVLGNAGGTQSRIITQAMLPNVSLTISGITLSDPTHAHTQDPQTMRHPGAGTFGLASGGFLGDAGGTTANASTGITVASQGSAALGGSGNQFPFIPPAMGVNCMMRIA